MIIIFIFTGLTAGVLSGLFGVGGAIVIIPSLMYICGFEQLKAQGTSLAILLPPAGILAFLEYYKNDNVDIRAGIIICVGVVIGAYFGGKYAHILPASVLKKGFAIFLMIAALKMLLEK